jgi:hypothetical protein
MELIFKEVGEQLVLMELPQKKLRTAEKTIIFSLTILEVDFILILKVI